MASAPTMGNKLRRFRRESAVTQVEMARGLGISPSYLNLIEHNRRPLTPTLLHRLREKYQIDETSLSTGEEARLLAELMDISGDPVFHEPNANRQAAFGHEELIELVGGAPNIARALLSLYHGYQRARDELRGSGEHLVHDPYISTSRHQLLTRLTSVRSYSEILRDNLDLAAARRQRFLGIVAEESERLTDQVNELFDFIGKASPHTGLGSPSAADEVTDLLQAHDNHFPELEAAADALRRKLGTDQIVTYEALVTTLAAEHDVGVHLVAIDRPAGESASGTRPEGDQVDGDQDLGSSLVLSEALAEASRRFRVARRLAQLSCEVEIERHLAESWLSSPAAMDLYRQILANYLVGALLMPYDSFRDSAQCLRHDIELLQRRFGASYEQVCHRLSTLQRPREAGLPLHFVRVDIAGNISKRFTASGFRIPRHGGACPRWNLHGAFLNPARIDTQLVRLPDGTTYFCIARVVTKPSAGAGAPKSHYSIMIGCEASVARHLVYADGINLAGSETAVPVGVTCRHCVRSDCRQRAAPALGAGPRSPMPETQNHDEPPESGVAIDLSSVYDGG